MAAHIDGAAVSYATYQRLKCRCDGCVADHSRYQREYRARRRRTGRPVAQHRGMSHKVGALARDAAAKWVRAHHPDVWAQLRAEARAALTEASS